MLDVKGDKKMVQNHVFKKFKKIVTLKDLHNMSYDKTASITNANELIEEMKKVAGKV